MSRRSFHGLDPRFKRQRFAPYADGERVEAPFGAYAHTIGDGFDLVRVALRPAPRRPVVEWSQPRGER